MKSIVLTPLLILVLGIACAPVTAQDPGAMKPKDVKDLAKALAERRRWNPNRSRERRRHQKAEAALAKVLARVEKNAKGGSHLAQIDSWSEVFSTIFNSDKKDSEGKGRVKTDKVSRTIKGQEIGYGFAYRLPAKYDGRKASYPLLICLHDKGSTGEKYLKEVWEANKDIKALADQFILLAPTVGTKTLGKKSEMKRIGWFDQWHLFNIFLPLRHILETYSIDVNRIYIEGTGYGGETALQLASLRARDFAAVAVRSAKPRRPEFTQNLLNVPTYVAERKGGVWSDPEAVTLRKELEAEVKDVGMKLQIKEFPPLPDAKTKRKALGTQKKDPVHESTPEIAAFFLANERDPYPAQIRFVTESFRFGDLPWVRLKTVDASPEEKRLARVHAKVDRGSNQIDLTTENVVSLILNLNDKIVDLDKPVKVIVNGKPYIEKKFERDLAFMLSYNKYNPYDPKVAFTANILVSVPQEEEQGKEGDEKNQGAGEGESDGDGK